VGADDPKPDPPARQTAPVTASAVLAALSEVRRRGHWPLLQELETIEPELTGFVLEEISAIHGTLLKTGARHKAVRRLQRQVQSLALIVILSVRPIQRDDDDDAQSIATKDR
jgi:hypothetical protein